GGERPTARLVLGHDHPVPGPGQEIHGGALDVAEPGLHHTAGEYGSSAQTTGAADGASYRGGPVEAADTGEGPRESGGQQPVEPEPAQKPHSPGGEAHQCRIGESLADEEVA